MRTYVLILFSFLVPLFLILANLNMLVYDNDFYMKEFEKNGVYEFIEKEDVAENYLLLIEYFKNDNNLETSFFNEKEKMHMADVKRLIVVSKYLIYAIGLSLLGLVIYLARKKSISIIGKGLVIGGASTIAIILLLLLLSSVNFYGLFVGFHLAFFSNDLWLLNPETDNLIVMFPGQFFYDAFKSVLAKNLLMAILIFFIGFLLTKYKKRGDEIESEFRKVR